MDTTQEILAAIDEEFGQSQVYMWSTYILPNGHFLNPENGNDYKDDESNIDYEHSDFDYWAEDNFGNKALYVLEDHCIKMNVTYPYLFLPRNRVTPEQIKAIKQIINNRDFEYDHDGIHSWLDTSTDDLYDMEEPLLILTANNTEKVFDLAIYSPEEVVREIARSYSLGNFLTEATSNSFRYIDERWIELYDYYDEEANEPIPQILLDAKVLKEEARQRTVHIDYPTDGYFSLDSPLGRATYYEACGKKAFVREGHYEHPYKGYKVDYIEMEPYDYIEDCAAIFTSRFKDGKVVTAEELIKERLKDYDLDEVFGMGNMFPLVLDYQGGDQEGLHRAIFAMMHDIPSVPVIIILE